MTKAMKQSTAPKSDFQNGILTEDRGIVSIRLGLDRKKSASFSYKSDWLTVEAATRKKRTHDECQDTAICHIGKETAVFGLFDGFGSSGTLISTKVADTILKLLSNGVQVNDLIPMVEYDLKLLSRSPEYQHGGSTAILVCLSHDQGIRPDAGFRAYRVSDATLFLLGQTGVKALASMEDLSGSMGVLIRDMLVDDYLDQRRKVRNVLKCDRDDIAEITSDGGFIRKGRGGLLVTDGVTKNLRFNFDFSSGQVTDTNGAEDLSAIIRGKNTPRAKVQSIISEIRKRTAEPAAKERFYVGKVGTALYAHDDDMGLICFSVR